MSDIGRTSNPAFQGLPGRTEAFEKYARAASEVARTPDYQKMGQEALATALSVSYEHQGTRVDVSGKPQLQAPATHSDTRVDKFTLLMAMLSELFGDVDGEKLKSRLAMVRNIAAGKQEHLEKISAGYAAAVDSFITAEAQVGSSQEELLKLNGQLRQLQAQFDASAIRLAELDVDAPEHVQALARHDRLKGDLATGTQSLQTATDAHLQLIGIANSAATAVAAQAATVQESAASSPALKESRDKALSSSAQALLNRLKIIEMLGESAQNKQELNQDLFLELQARLQEHMELESDKYLEEVSKAQALQETMGCIGKVIGGVIVALSVALAIVMPTPAWIATAAIGLALLAADNIYEAAAGESLMAKALKPLMDLMQDAIEWFTKAVTDVLLFLGVDPEAAKDVARIAGPILGVVATLTGVALAVVVGVQVVGPMIGAISSKLASVVAQVAPAAVETLKQVATSMGNTLTQLLTQLRSVLTRGADAVSLARYVANLEFIKSIVEFAGVAVPGGLQFASSLHQSKAAGYLADVRVRMAISEEITSFLTRLLEDYGQVIRDRSRQIEQLFADLKNSHFTRLKMIQNV